MTVNGAFYVVQRDISCPNAPTCPNCPNFVQVNPSQYIGVYTLFLNHEASHEYKPWASNYCIGSALMKCYQGFDATVRLAMKTNGLHKGQTGIHTCLTWVGPFVNNPFVQDFAHLGAFVHFVWDNNRVSKIKGV